MLDRKRNVGPLFNNMDDITKLFNSIKTKYDHGEDPLEETIQISKLCLEKLTKDAQFENQGQIGTKEYGIFKTDSQLSRPILRDLFSFRNDDIQELSEEILRSIDSSKHMINSSPETVNRFLYKIIGSFSCCYDLWKNSSRKTPGTFFEILIGSILERMLPEHSRSKHIAVPNEDYKIATDIVFEDSTKQKGLVFPVKITTRERIIQPFVHQRICDAVFGNGRYSSFLLCMSELKRTKEEGVAEICVPGPVKMCQKYLAQLSGIYYLDPPLRYLADGMSESITISSIGQLLTNDLSQHL